MRDTVNRMILKSMVAITVSSIVAIVAQSTPSASSGGSSASSSPPSLSTSPSAEAGSLPASTGNHSQKPSYSPVGTVPAVPRGAVSIGPAPAGQTVRVDIALKPRNPAALATFASEVSTPGSAIFHQYLKPGQFRRIFGATSAGVRAVRDVLSRIGVHVGQTTSNDLIIPLLTTVARMQAAFHTKLDEYRLPSGRIAFSNVSPPLLPDTITPYIEGVIGLSTLVIPKPLRQGPAAGSALPGPHMGQHIAGNHLPLAQLPQSARTIQAAKGYRMQQVGQVRPTLYPQAVAAPSRSASKSQSRSQSQPQSQPGTAPEPYSTTGPQPCTDATNTAQSPPQQQGSATYQPGWTANQIASAYGFTSAYAHGALGAGQTIALFELGAPYLPSDISAYESCYGIHTVVNPISVDGGASGKGVNTEADEDIEIAASFDPQATIDVYQAPSTTTSYVDEFSRIATNDSAQVVSVSYGWCESAVAAGANGGMSAEKTVNTIMEQMAAQGQTVMVAAGDTGSETCLRGEGQAPLFFVSCPQGSTFCMASDGNGNTFTFDGSAWSFAGNPSGGEALGISCPTSTRCMAMDAKGNGYSWNGTSWSAPVPVDPKYMPTDISCPSTNFCVAIDAGGNAFMYDGSSWSSAYNIDPSGYLASVSCASSTFCIAVNKGNDAITWNGSSWSTPYAIDYSGEKLTGISCPSSSVCVAVDGFGQSVWYQNGSWGSPIPVITDGGGFTSVDCISANFCAAVDSMGYAYEYLNGQTASVDADGTTPLTSVSCASEILCVAVDVNGNAIVDTGSGPSAPQLVDLGNATLNVSALASDPYVTSVGGTTLESVSSPPQETVWNNGISTPGGGAGGGGISTFWPMPTWQQDSGVPGVVSALSSGTPCGAASGGYCREIPDVAASANWYQGGYALYFNGTWVMDGGTSAATPTWASLMALANQICGTRIGFASPLLYKIAAQHPSAFNNITSGNNDYAGTNGGLYPAATGSQHYSMAAGLGSPNGPSLINDICNASTPVPAPTVASVTPSSGSTAGGTVVTITGINFTSYSMVYFGSTPATVSAKSSTLLTVVSPSGSPGIVPITVTNSGGASKPAGFVYITPNIPYAPVTPYRITDTRCAEDPLPAGITSTYCSALPAANRSIASPPSGGSITIQVTGIGSGVNAVPASAQSVELNVTAIASSDASSGYLTAYPAGTRVPEASSVNYMPGVAVPNMVTAALGQNGKISIYSSSSDVNIVVDIEGYYEPDASTPDLFNPLSLPERLLDTRCSTTSRPTYCSSENLPTQNSSLAAPQPSRAIAVAVTGLDNVPAGATAISAVLTAAHAQASGYLSVWPDNGSCNSPPAVSNVNFDRGQSVANSITVKAGSSGKICVYNGSSAPVNPVIDLNGYYSLTGDTFTPSSPVRICDTRSASKIGGKTDVSSGVSGQCANSGQSLDPFVGTSDPFTVRVAGLAGIPSTAVAVVANITVVSTAGAGFLTAWPAGSKQPETSNINWTAGEVVPNMVTAALSSSGTISVYASAGANIVVDMMGYYASGTSGGGGGGGGSSNGTWSAPARVDSNDGLYVSCVSSSFCVVVDESGNVLTWNGTSWSTPQAVDPNGGGFSSISCAAPDYCVASDQNGGSVVTYG
ncbi:MAG: protease pro-enzyme activation domain-containing protein [Actinobacteria bacterium]|nr:protease pro-enzyme activation domain-containing protein [Actinomycetota bacterium]MCL5446652.1 protease pro-enzyme activation domain-containing protein [Actinomycetota bacterium]